MDGEKGEFQALGGSLALHQKGEFQALRGTLSLDLSNCKLRADPQPSNESRTDPTLEQKQYAQGFLDALRAVQQIHNFEFEKKVLSPGFIAPIVGTAEFLTPLISPSSRDYQAILNAMVAKTPIMQPVGGNSANSSLATNTGFPTAISTPGTSSAAAPSTSATVTAADSSILPKVEIKQEPLYISEDLSESDRSRSSSTVTTRNTRSLKGDSAE
uniref:Jun domain-containing protein n=1 Tax=Angiostrongylus cantonensis TaxID=6313 RepID=A0A0K0DAM5_ANGCA